MRPTRGVTWALLLGAILLLGVASGEFAAYAQEAKLGQPKADTGTLDARISEFRRETIAKFLY